MVSAIIRSIILRTSAGTRLNDILLRFGRLRGAILSKCGKKHSIQKY
jgi:hypothetical protein